jgi:hypothetical protein
LEDEMDEKEVRTLKDVPPMTLFRREKSGTVYVKLADGSIRNVDKAARKAGLLDKKGRIKKDVDRSA